MHTHTHTCHTCGSHNDTCGRQPSLARARAVRSYADSKALTEAERARLFGVLAADAACAYSVDVLSAAAISGAMLGRSRVSLNALAEEATTRLIRGVLDVGVALREVRCACCVVLLWCCLTLHCCAHASGAAVQ